MWIEVNSPHSGRPVRVREQDVGRSVRDDEGRVFFVLPRSDGQGHYGSVTRTGGPAAEEKYLAMLADEGRAQAAGDDAGRQPVHDATGRKRSSWKGKLVLVILLLLVLLLVYLFTIGPFGGDKFPWRAPPTPTAPSDQGQGTGP